MGRRVMALAVIPDPRSVGSIPNSVILCALTGRILDVQEITAQRALAFVTVGGELTTDVLADVLSASTTSDVHHQLLARDVVNALQVGYPGGPDAVGVMLDPELSWCHEL